MAYMIRYPQRVAINRNLKIEASNICTGWDVCSYVIWGHRITADVPQAASQETFLKSCFVGPKYPTGTPAGIQGLRSQHKEHV